MHNGVKVDRKFFLGVKLVRIFYAVKIYMFASFN